MRQRSALPARSGALNRREAAARITYPEPEAVEWQTSQAIRSLRCGADPPEATMLVVGRAPGARSRGNTTAAPTATARSPSTSGQFAGCVLRADKGALRATLRRQRLR